MIILKLTVPLKKWHFLASLAVIGTAKDYTACGWHSRFLIATDDVT